MTDAEILISFMDIILFVNGYIVGFLLYILFYVYKSLRFLRSTAKAMVEHEDNTDEIYNEEIPSIHNIKAYVRFEIFIALFVYCTNHITKAYTLVPDAQLLGTWTILIYVSAVGTAYIILSVFGMYKLKRNIDVICGSYNITLNAYKFIDDANKDKNNDSTD